MLDNIFSDSISVTSEMLSEIAKAHKRNPSGLLAIENVMLLNFGIIGPGDDA